MTYKMKKLVTSLMFAAALVAPFAAGARNVSVSEAREAAAYYMERNTLEYGIKPADLVLLHQIDNEELGVPAVYAFNVSDWGWIIMTGSTAIDPVVGFGDEGNIDAWEKLAPAMRWWVETFADAVKDVQMQDVEGKFDDMPEWSDLFNQTLTVSAKDGDPRIILMKTYWDQGETRNPTYNKRCPYDSTSHKYTYVGCVATAMSQIMRYYGFPLAATGGRVNYTTESNQYFLKLKFDTLRFDYSLMPVRLNSYSSTSQVDEVARLCYAAGVSVHMDYGTDGSGASSLSVPMAMANYFKYTQGVLTLRSSTSTTNFLSMLRNDLLLRRPAYMAGASSTGGGADAAGHAWVCCGYRTDDSNQYYMNWGWSGGGDGFFNLRANTAITPQGYGYNFNVRQEHITGMVPPHADSSSVDFLTAIDRVESNTVLAPAYPNPAAVTVTLPYSTTVDAELQIFSIDGKLVATRRLMPGNGEVELRVAEMPAGIYIYRMGGSSGKFIVQ